MTPYSRNDPHNQSYKKKTARMMETLKKLKLTATTTTQTQEQDMIAGCLKISPRNSSNHSNVSLGLGCLGLFG